MEVSDYKGQPPTEWTWSVWCGQDLLIRGQDQASRERAWAMAEAHLRLHLLRLQPRK